MTDDQDPKTPDTSGHLSDAYSPPTRDPVLRRNKAMLAAIVVLVIAIVVYLIALLLD